MPRCELDLELAEAELRQATAHMTDFILSRPCPADRLRETLRVVAVFVRVGTAFSAQDLDRLAASFGNAPGWEACPEPDDAVLVV